MAELGPHCPFLNRTDDRCSAHFSLDRLRLLFQECFGEYQTCPVYTELLAERRARRAEANPHQRNRLVELGIPGHESRALLPLPPVPERTEW